MGVLSLLCWCPWQLILIGMDSFCYLYLDNENDEISHRINPASHERGKEKVNSTTYRERVRRHVFGVLF